MKSAGLIGAAWDEREKNLIRVEGVRIECIHITARNLTMGVYDVPDAPG